MERLYIKKSHKTSLQLVILAIERSCLKSIIYVLGSRSGGESRSNFYRCLLQQRSERRRIARRG
ncbi:MAG: hypothetical protein ACRC2V_23955 [Xenococcaceae cyanobacterium]